MRHPKPVRLETAPTGPDESRLPAHLKKEKVCQLPRPEGTGLV